MSEKRSGIIRIPSHELPTQPEGWVEISAYVKRKHLPYIAALQTVDENILANANTSAQEKAREMRKFDEFHASFVYGWNWTDGEGVAYPEPHGNADAFGELRQEEWAWLQGKINEVMAQNRIPKSSDTPS